MFNNFMPTPLVNGYQSPMQMYRHGGHPHQQYPYHQEAEMLQHFGTGRDRILAHINPAEASYLQHHHGMSVNPHTGLPQFGLYDSLKSGASKIGSMALSAAPGIWADYGRPLAQRGLEAFDTGVQGLLPYGAGMLGNIAVPGIGGTIGSGIGQALANQYGQYGGLAGQILPRIDAKLGVQGPAQFPQFGRGNLKESAMQFGQDLWRNTGRGMMRGKLENADQRLMESLPNMGSRVGGALGNRFGMGESGSSLGSRIGGGLANMYGGTSGISGQVMPRLNQAIENFGQPSIPMPPPPPPAAMGGAGHAAFNPSDIRQRVSPAMAHGGSLHYPYPFHY